eukprot:scaffold8899_cov79-Isochrysis_galbana.AAC.1
MEGKPNRPSSPSRAAQGNGGGSRTREAGRPAEAGREAEAALRARHTETCTHSPRNAALVAARVQSSYNPPSPLTLPSRPPHA